MILVLTLMLNFVTTSHAMHVVVDPGHGGNDHGASYYGLTEARINLSVALELKKILENDPDFKVSMTRNNNSSLSLSERAELATKFKGDLFISIHANAFNKPNAKGVEFYFQNQLPADQEAMYLANQENFNLETEVQNEWPLEPIQDASKYSPEVLSIIKDLQLGHRILLSSILAHSLYSEWTGYKKEEPHSIKQAPFFVISNISMPSNLIELGYLSNKREAHLLRQKKFQKAYARSIYSGLIKYKELIDKHPDSHLD